MNCNNNFFDLVKAISPLDVSKDEEFKKAFKWISY